ncbi:MAG: ABC transporter permease [Firmicutes bacterium]|nr:ABC transporter permease [Bacillota bacterium]
MNAIRGMYVIWLREIIRFYREPTRIIGMIAQPLLYLILVGNGLSHGFALRTGGRDTDYLTFMFPGIVGMSVLFTSMFSAMSIVWDREFGFLKEVLVSAVPRSAIALGKALGGSTIALAQGVILLLLAPLAHISLSFGRFWAVLGILALLALTLNSLGLAIASRMRSVQGFQVIMNFLIMPMFFLSGAIYPLKGMPAWLMDLMRIDPLTYGVDALRHVIYASPLLVKEFTEFSMTTDLSVIVIIMLLLLSLATFSFARTSES